MFYKKNTSGPLDDAINLALSSLKNHPVGSEEYVRTLNAVAKLHRLKMSEKASSVSKDTLILAATNILGILMVLRYEAAQNLITSKALNFVLRNRP